MTEIRFGREPGVMGVGDTGKGGGVGILASKQK